MRLKRYVAPAFWTIDRKHKKYTVSPRPGPHEKSRCIPLAIIIRDYLKYSANGRETKSILNQGLVRVDGRKITDHAFPVGLMDVINIKDEYYRIVPVKKGLTIKKTDASDANVKIFKIVNKTIIKGNKIQLNLHDGRNLITETDCRTNDVIVYDVNSKKIINILKFKKGSVAIVIRGKNSGVRGTIKDLIKVSSIQPINRVVLKTKDGEITVPQKYLFVVGEDKPVINIGE